MDTDFEPVKPRFGLPSPNTRKGMNSRNKGKRGEREFAALLRAHGFDARRGQQFAGGAESPDVICDALGWLHVEVKRVQKLNLPEACTQALRDCGGRPWIVAHRRNRESWLITMSMKTFLELLGGTLPPKATCAQPGNGGARQETKETNKQ